MKYFKSYGPLILLVLLIDFIAEMIGMQIFLLAKLKFQSYRWFLQ